ncbi:MAG: uncharacterized protein A8A55_1574 [Amphiamblys sp. WSBS2006]|nr:MAG: uncharacterized protein A8A55_1574 [Amphiamblys sp. WSBS2006]
MTCHTLENGTRSWKQKESLSVGRHMKKPKPAAFLLTKPHEMVVDARTAKTEDRVEAERLPNTAESVNTEEAGNKTEAPFHDTTDEDIEANHTLYQGNLRGQRCYSKAQHRAA